MATRCNTSYRASFLLQFQNGLALTPIKIDMTHIVRTITKRFAPPQIRNAFHGCGYSMRHIRHTPIARVLGCFPRPVLLEVLGWLEATS